MVQKGISVPRKSLLTSTALAGLVLAYPAMAADIPAGRPMPVKAVVAPVPAWSWTGLYVGVNGGYAWGNSATDCSITDAGSASPCRGVTFPSLRPSGALLGGEV